MTARRRLRHGAVLSLSRAADGAAPKRAARPVRAPRSAPRCGAQVRAEERQRRSRRTRRRGGGGGSAGLRPRSAAHPRDGDVRPQGAALGDSSPARRGERDRQCAVHLPQPARQVGHRTGQDVRAPRREPERALDAQRQRRCDLPAGRAHGGAEIADLVLGAVAEEAQRDVQRLLGQRAQSEVALRRLRPPRGQRRTLAGRQLGRHEQARGRRHGMRRRSTIRSSANGPATDHASGRRAPAAAGAAGAARRWSRGRGRRPAIRAAVRAAVDARARRAARR